MHFEVQTNQATGSTQQPTPSIKDGRMDRVGPRVRSLRFGRSVASFWQSQSQALAVRVRLASAKVSGALRTLAHGKFRTRNIAVKPPSAAGLKETIAQLRAAPFSRRRALGYGGYALGCTLLALVLWQIGLTIFGGDRESTSGFETAAVIALPPHPANLVADANTPDPGTDVLGTVPEAQIASLPATADPAAPILAIPQVAFESPDAPPDHAAPATRGGDAPSPIARSDEEPYSIPSAADLAEYARPDLPVHATTVARLDDPTGVRSDPTAVPLSPSVAGADISRDMPPVEPESATIARLTTPSKLTSDAVPPPIPIKTEQTSATSRPGAEPEQSIAARISEPSPVKLDATSEPIPPPANLETGAPVAKLATAAPIANARLDDPDRIVLDAVPARLPAEATVDAPTHAPPDVEPSGITVARLNTPDIVASDTLPVAMSLEADLESAARTAAPEQVPQATIARLANPATEITDAVPAPLPWETAVDAPTHTPPDLEPSGTTVARLTNPDTVASDTVPVAMSTEADVESAAPVVAPEEPPQATIARLANPTSVITDAAPEEIPAATDFYAPANVVTLDELADTAVSGIDNPSIVGSDAKPERLPANTYLDGFSHVLPPREPPQAAPAGPVFAPRTLAPVDAPPPPNSADLLGAELLISPDAPPSETMPWVNSPQIETAGVASTPIMGELAVDPSVPKESPAEPAHVTLARLDDPTAVTSDAIASALPDDADLTEFSRSGPAPEPALDSPRQIAVPTTDASDRDSLPMPDAADMSLNVAADGAPAATLETPESSSGPVEIASAIATAPLPAVTAAPAALRSETPETPADAALITSPAPAVNASGDIAAPSSVPQSAEPIIVAGKLAAAPTPAGPDDILPQNGITELPPDALPESALDPLPDALGPGKLAEVPTADDLTALPAVVEAALSSRPDDPLIAETGGAGELAPQPDDAIAVAPEAAWVDPDTAANLDPTNTEIEIAATGETSEPWPRESEPGPATVDARTSRGVAELTWVDPDEAAARDGIIPALRIAALNDATGEWPRQSDPTPAQNSTALSLQNTQAATDQSAPVWVDPDEISAADLSAPPAQPGGETAESENWPRETEIAPVETVAAAVTDPQPIPVEDSASAEKEVVSDVIPIPRAAPLTELAAVDQTIVINRMIMTRGVENREPIDNDRQFRVDDGTVFAFVSVKNTGPATQITVSWYNGDVLALSTKLKVGNAASWRTWSKSAVSRGNWRVEIRDEDGAPLAETAFTVE